METISPRVPQLHTSLNTHCVICFTEHPGLSDADCGLRSDVVSKSGLQASTATRFAARYVHFWPVPEHLAVISAAPPTVHARCALYLCGARSGRALAFRGQSLALSRSRSLSLSMCGTGGAGGLKLCFPSFSRADRCSHFRRCCARMLSPGLHRAGERPGRQGLSAALAAPQHHAPAILHVRQLRHHVLTHFPHVRNVQWYPASHLLLSAIRRVKITVVPAALHHPAHACSACDHGRRRMLFGC